MTHPFARVPRGRRRRVFLPLVGATLAVWAAMLIIDQAIRTGAAPDGIVSFELAADLATAERIMASWDPLARMHATFGLGLDFLFLCLYSTTIGFACVWAASVVGERGWPLAGLGALVAWAQWLAAALDASENTALIVLLLRGPAEPWPAVAWWSAAPKFALVLLGLAYAGYGVVARFTASPGSTRRSTR